MGGRRSIVDWAQSNFIRPAEQVDRQRAVCDGLGMGGRMKVFQKALVRDWRVGAMQRMRPVKAAGTRESRDKLGCSGRAILTEITAKCADTEKGALWAVQAMQFAASGALVWTRGD